MGRMRLLQSCLVVAGLVQAIAAFAHDAPGEVPPADATTPFWIGPAASGAWFDPARSGEGWMIEMQPDGSAVAVWFTYAPAGEAAGQRWILGQGGVVEGDRIVFETAYVMSGGRFGPQFDPDDVIVAPWGRLEFVFADCEHGELAYDGPPAYGSGARSFQRSAALHETGCTLARATTERGARAQASLRTIAGTWFDPAHNGEGVILQPLTDTLVATTWFSYTADGAPAWFTGIGTLHDGVLVAEAMTRPQGARFGADFDPGDVHAAPWGRVTLAFEGCGAATLSYASTESAFGSGTLQLQRVTTPAGGVCLDAFPAARTSGSWSAGPSMPRPASEIATAVDGSAMYIAGNYPVGRTFQRFDAASGAWSVLPDLPGGRDHAMAFAFDGGVFVVGGYRGGPDATSPAWRYDIAARTFEPLDGLPAIVASGAAWLNGDVYLGHENGDLVQFDPRTYAHRIVRRHDTTYRDHSQLIAYLGELWMIGGRVRAGAHRSVAIYDPASDTWRAGPPMREARSGFAAAVVDHQIVVAGGEQVAPDLVLIEGMEMIAAGADTWERGPDLPIGVHGVGGAVHAGRFHALGGSVQAGVASNPGVVQIYTPR